MTINIFVLKGDLNGEIRSGAFLFLLGIYEAWRYACKSCTHGHRMWELAVAPWTSSTQFSHECWLPVHSLHQQIAVLRSDLAEPLRSAINRAGSSSTLCTPIIRIRCQLLELAEFLIDAVVAYSWVEIYLDCARGWFTVLIQLPGPWSDNTCLRGFRQS